MAWFNGRYWKDYIEKRVRPNFERFGEIVLARILPVFDNINEEASELERRRHKELRQSVVVHNEDDFWAADEAMANLAFEEAAEHHEVLWAMKSATLNLYAAAIYHLYEQHIVDLVAEIVGYHGPDEMKADQAADWFRDKLGVDLRLFESWPTMKELRLLANVVKHGAGWSAEDLRELRPELFVYPAFRKEQIGAARLRVRKPLFGEDLYVTTEAFEGYQAAAVAFWNELRDQLPDVR